MARVRTTEPWDLTSVLTAAGLGEPRAIQSSGSKLRAHQAPCPANEFLERTGKRTDEWFADSESRWTAVAIDQAGRDASELQGRDARLGIRSTPKHAVHLPVAGIVVPHLNTKISDYPGVAG